MKIKTLVAEYGYEEACLLCGSLKDLTVDHLIPTSRGGAESGPHIILCRVCNQFKGSFLIEEMVEHIDKIYPRLRDILFFKKIFEPNNEKE